MVLGFFAEKRMELLDKGVDQKHFLYGELELEDLDKTLAE